MDMGMGYTLDGWIDIKLWKMKNKMKEKKFDILFARLNSLI